MTTNSIRNASEAFWSNFKLPQATEVVPKVLDTIVRQHAKVSGMIKTSKDLDSSDDFETPETRRSHRRNKKLVSRNFVSKHGGNTKKFTFRELRAIVPESPKRDRETARTKRETIRNKARREFNDSRRPREDRDLYVNRRELFVTAERDYENAVEEQLREDMRAQFNVCGCGDCGFGNGYGYEYLDSYCGDSHCYYRSDDEYSIAEDNDLTPDNSDSDSLRSEN